MKYTVLLFLGGRGWITATVPALPGCVSQGRTREEALENVREAIDGCLAASDEDQNIAPAEETLEAVLEGVKEALDIQRAIREDDGEELEPALELITVSFPTRAAA